MTQEELATTTGIDRATVSRYERGERQPDINTALKIAESLKYPYSFFFEGKVSTEELEGVSFRSRRSEVRLATRLRTISAGHLASGVISPAVLKYFNLPQPDLPNYEGMKPAVAADLLRVEWGLSHYPVKNLIHLLEAKGIRVFWFEEDDTAVDAVSFFFQSTPFILVSQRNRGGERVRMDIAHELGHLVLHKGRRDKSIKTVEEEATSFASAFLVPAETFKKEVPTYPLISHLFAAKARWKVSVQALIRRCYDLDIYTETQYRGAIRRMYDNGWRTREPHPIEWEESRIFEKVFLYLREKDKTSYDFALDLHLPMDELESLIPIARQFKEIKAKDLKHLTIEELGYSPPGDRPLID